jgi:serine phosphatase RsbU (regulator of sigma subunit)
MNTTAQTIFIWMCIFFMGVVFYHVVQAVSSMSSTVQNIFIWAMVLLTSAVVYLIRVLQASSRSSKAMEVGMPVQAVLGMLHRTSAAAGLPFVPRLPLRLSLWVLGRQAQRQNDFRSLVSDSAKGAGSMLNTHVEIIEDGPTIAALVYRQPALHTWNAVDLPGATLVRICGYDGEIRAILKLKPKTRRLFGDPEREYLRELARQIEKRAEAFKERESDEDFKTCIAEIRSILPQAAPEVRGFTLNGKWLAGHSVRGDYYDFFRLDDAKIALIVADGPGRGQPAIALTRSLQTILRTYATADASPAEVCVRTNQEVCRSFAAGTVIRLFYAVVDTQRKEISFSNSGLHPPYLVRRKGACYQFDIGGPVLGALPDAAYEETTFDLIPGDRFAIYTDGLVRAGEHRGEDQEFGSGRLIDILRKHPLSNAKDLCNLVLSEWDGFRGRDDVALVTMTVR